MKAIVPRMKCSRGDPGSSSRSLLRYRITSYNVCYTKLLRGSVGSPDGWSTIFVRTAKGEEYLNKMVEAGALETKDIDAVKPGLDLVQKLAISKKEKNGKEVEHRKEIGLPIPY